MLQKYYGGSFSENVNEGRKLRNFLEIATKPLKKGLYTVECMTVAIRFYGFEDKAARIANMEGF